MKGSDSDAEMSKLQSKKGFVKSAHVGKKIQILIQKREHFENNLKILKFFKSVIKEELGIILTTLYFLRKLQMLKIS